MHGKEGKIWFGRNLMGHVGVMAGVSECNRNALLANKVTFCVLQHLLPIQRKSLHIRPVLCRKFMEKEAFCLIPDTLEHDFRGILTSCLASNGLRRVSPRTSKYGL